MAAKQTERSQSNTTMVFFLCLKGIQELVQPKLMFSFAFIKFCFFVFLLHLPSRLKSKFAKVCHFMFALSLAFLCCKLSVNIR